MFASLPAIPRAHRGKSLIPAPNVNKEVFSEEASLIMETGFGKVRSRQTEFFQLCGLHLMLCLPHCETCWSR